MTAQTDRAVRSLDEDLLDRKPFIDRLVSALINERLTELRVSLLELSGNGEAENHQF